MLSHDLARLLLRCPNLPVATHANNHDYMSKKDARSHGPLRVGILETYDGQHISIGNLSKRMLNPPNWWISETIECELPDGWGADGWGGEKRYAGLTTGSIKHYSADLHRLRLHSDGIDRFTTGRVGTWSAMVDARCGQSLEDEKPKWGGHAWSDEGGCVAETGHTFESFAAALAELNSLVSKFDREIFR